MTRAAHRNDLKPSIGLVTRLMARWSRSAMLLGYLTLRTTLFHHLLEVPVTQRVSHLPANADRDHVGRKAHPFEVEHLDSSWVRAPQLTRLSRQSSLMRQNQFATNTKVWQNQTSSPLTVGLRFESGHRHRRRCTSRSKSSSQSVAMRWLPPPPKEQRGRKPRARTGYARRTAYTRSQAALRCILFSKTWSTPR